MNSIKDDLLRIISQDIDDVREKSRALRKTIPGFIKHALDAADDFIAAWSTKPRQFPRKKTKK